MRDEGKKTEDLKSRTRRFALGIVRLYGELPKSTEAQVIGRQLLRSGTSPGAHYREAVRARSNAELISKMQGGLQELEETVYWLELLAEAKIIPKSRLTDLMNETDQLIAIFVTCVKNAKQRTSR